MGKGYFIVSRLHDEIYVIFDVEKFVKKQFPNTIITHIGVAENKVAICLKVKKP